MALSRACRLTLTLWCALAALASAQESPAAPSASEPAQKPPPAAMSGLGLYEGRTVREIEFRDYQGDAAVMKSLHDKVEQPLNAPLDRHKVGNSMKALFETGRFADLQAVVEPASPDGVRLWFVAKPNYFVQSVEATGAPPRPSNSQLVDISKLQLGQAYNADRVKDSLAAMHQALADNGWYQAEVSAAETYHDPTYTVSVLYTVKRGSQARIGQLIVQGTPGHSNAELRSKAHLGEGDAVSADRLASALQRLRKMYSRENRLEAQITVANRIYHPENNTLDYVLRIDRGPVVQVKEVGANLGARKIRELVPVYEEHAADEDLLNEGRANIRDYLQTQGYFDANVDYRKTADLQKDHVQVTYTVEKGPKHDLSAVVLEGNKYFGSDTLRERMDIQPASWPLLPHGRYSEEMRDHDVQSIIGLYMANGFEHVQVTADVQDDYQGRVGQIAVFYHIVEGPQTLVGKFDVTGNDTFPGEQLTNALAAEAAELYNQPGQPFSRDNITKDRDAILNFYFNQGFPNVSFEAKTTPAAGDPQHEDVEYHIVEGRREWVDRIVTSGLHYTKPFVAAQQFEIQAGDPLSQAKMLDTQRRLYDLGVFNEVRMAVSNPEGTAVHKDLMVHYQEARRWTLTYGLGVEIQSGFLGARTNPQGQAGASPRVTFNVNRINFGGRAHTLTLQSHVGSLQQRGLIRYDAPRWYGYKNLRLTFTAFYDNSLDVRTFTSQRMEGSAQLEQVLNRASTFLYRFTYRRVRATDLVVDPSLIPLLSRPVRVGLPSITYIRDHRDDPIDTHNGNYNTLDAGVASGVFGSEAAFGRALGQNVTYTSFRSNAPNKRFVFARSLRLGAAEPFGATSVLPLPERFFAGGGNTLRGYAINQAGPRDLISGLPLGGNAMIVNNFELRLPPIALPYLGDNLSFVIFEDAGNVFESASKAAASVLRWHQLHPDQCKAAALAQLGSLPDTNVLHDACRFDYISHSIGGGIRYKTPIGPVRFDLGYNLNPPVFPVLGIDPLTGKVISARYEQLSHFNFFFSIGQTF